MKLKPTFQTLLAFFFLVFTFSTQAQTVFFEEDFEIDSLSTWTIENPVTWTLGEAMDLSSAYFNIPEHTKIVAVNDDAPGAGTPSSGRIISPTVELTGTNPKIIIFDAFFIDGDYAGANETLYAEIQLSGSEDWERVAVVQGLEGAWQERLRAEIPSEYDDQTVRFAFNYQDDDGWNYGAAIDNVIIQELAPYDAQTFIRQTSLPTITPVSQINPFIVEYGINSLGSEALTNVVFDATISLNGNEVDGGQDIIGTVEATYTNKFEFTPTEVGEYTIDFSASESNLGDLGTSQYTYIVSDSILAKDSGIPEGQLGFGFGDPNWYGYYGSEFYLENSDTLTSLSVHISEFSDPEGSFNFTVNLFDELGESPSDEVFHSEEIFLDSTTVGTFVTYVLPEPIRLPAGPFVVAAGQDTVQGVVAFDFEDNEPEDAFWIVSPIAGGGYPWFYAIDSNPITMLIRPHFGTTPTMVNTAELQEEKLGINVSPNPFSDVLHIETTMLTGTTLAQITDLSGRLIKQTYLRDNTLDWSLSNLPSGMYLLHIQNEESSFTQKIVKE